MDLDTQRTSLRRLLDLHRDGTASMAEPTGRPFANVYEDEARAEAYSGLEFPGTYFLAFRDMAGLLRRHVAGRSALDFGCGAGRSSRFLKRLGFDVTGVDVSAPMLARARERDPHGTYALVRDGDLGGVGSGTLDLVFSAFTFDNVPDRAARAKLFAELRRLLSSAGRIVNLVSAPEIYVNEWASFSTRAFPENRSAGSGDTVRVVMLDVPDRRPVDDVLWLDSDYRDLYAGAGLDVVEVHRPLGTAADPYPWVSEEHTSPWVIYVLRRAGSPGGTEGAAASTTPGA